MKDVIKMQVIKALYVAALLVITSQTVCSVPVVVGKDVLAFQEALFKIQNRSDLEKNTPPTIKWRPLRRGAKIPYIDMPNKDLRGAIVADNLGRMLAESNLAGSNLTGANLSNAILFEANLTDTTFTHANLSNAYLNYATLTNATFINANLSKASVYKANFSGAKGLTADQKAYVRSQGALNVPA